MSLFIRIVNILRTKEEKNNCEEIISTHFLFLHLFFLIICCVILKYLWSHKTQIPLYSNGRNIDDPPQSGRPCHVLSRRLNFPTTLQYAWFSVISRFHSVISRGFSINSSSILLIRYRQWGSMSLTTFDWLYLISAGPVIMSCLTLLCGFELISFCFCFLESTATCS